MRCRWIPVPEPATDVVLVDVKSRISQYAPPYQSQFLQHLVATQQPVVEICPGTIIALSRLRGTMVESPSSAVEVRVADHFEDVIQVRLSTLETRVDAEAESVKEHFLEQRQFISFSLTRLAEQLRADWRADLSAAMRRVDERFGTVEGRLDKVDERLDRVEQKMDAYHEATQTVLRDILSRLPSTSA